MGICFGKKKNPLDNQSNRPKIRFTKEFNADHHFIPIPSSCQIIPPTPLWARYN